MEKKLERGIKGIKDGNRGGKDGYMDVREGASLFLLFLFLLNYLASGEIPCR